MIRIVILMVTLAFSINYSYSQEDYKRIRVGAGITYLFNLEALDNLGQPFIPFCHSASIGYQFSEKTAIEAKYSRYTMYRDFQGGFNEVSFRDIIFLTLNFNKVILSDGNYRLKSQFGVSARQAEESYRFNQIKYPGATFKPYYFNPAVSIGLSNEYIVFPALSLEFDANYYYSFIDKDRISYWSSRVDPNDLNYSVHNILFTLRIIGNINLSKRKTE